MGQERGQNMARKGENIRKRSDGRWEGRYIIYENDVKKVKSIYAPTYREAKQKLIQQKNLVAEQELLHSKEIQVNLESILTIEKVAEEWLIHTETQLEKEIKYSTFIKYKYIYQHYIKDIFGDSTLETLSDEYVLQHLDNSLSQSTTRSMYCVLNHILDFASSKYQISRRVLKRTAVKSSKNFIDVLNISEQTQLIQCLQCDMDIYKLGIYICLFTGLRLGEVCALRWSDIDMRCKLLHVNQTVQRIQTTDDDTKTTLLETSPKSFYSQREIPISDQLCVLLQEFECCDKYVLNGNTPLEPRTMQNRFKKCLKQAGIRNTNFHTLRHTFATNCIQMGADIKSVSEVLGHSDVKITLNRYVHPSMETKRGYMNSLSSFVQPEAIKGQKSGQNIS